MKYLSNRDQFLKESKFTGLQTYEKTPYSGEITAGARKRLKEACELMIEVTEEYSYYDRKQKRRVTYKIGFLTVTLSAGQDSVSDKDIKKHLLQPFIRKLRKFGLKLDGLIYI